MTTGDDHSRKKTRITQEQLTEMKRLSREGISISAIAREIGCHRQTVRMHLREKHGDIVADEVRKQVLIEELRNHFQQLARFAQVNLRLRLDASPPEHKKLKPGEPQVQASIFLGGILGLPYWSGATYMSQEWARMYQPSPRESHLLQSLREHTKDSHLWVHWDSWRKKVTNYEIASHQLLDWLEDTMESDLFEKIDPTRIDAIRWWLFGNILLTANGIQHDSLDLFRKLVIDPKGVIIARDPDRDADGSAALYDHLCGILNEAQQLSEWAKLRSTTEVLKSKESQLELRHIAKEIDYDLVSIELMHAFPGHCDLCPV